MKSYLARLVERAAPAPRTSSIPPITSARAGEAATTSEDPFESELIHPAPPDVAPTIPAGRPGAPLERSAPWADVTAPLSPRAPGQRRGTASPPMTGEPTATERAPVARGSEPAPEVEPPPRHVQVRPAEPSTATRRGEAATDVEQPSPEARPSSDEALALRLADQFMERMLGRTTPFAAPPTVEPPGERAHAAAPVLTPPPAPEPSAPSPPPSLVINQLRVDVVPPPPAPAQPTTRVVSSRGQRGGTDLAPPSSLRFGLGQV